MRRENVEICFILPHMNDVSDALLQCNSAEWSAPYGSHKFWQYYTAVSETLFSR